MQSAAEVINPFSNGSAAALSNDQERHTRRVRNPTMNTALFSANRRYGCQPVSRSLPRRFAARPLAALPLLAALAVLAGCINITINFPSAEVEQAADRIIDQVYGKDGAAQRTPATSTPATKPTALLLRTLDLLVPTANAASDSSAADLNASTPAVRALTAAMEARHPLLERYYTSGAVGLSDDGLVALRELSLVPLPERNAVRKLVDDENADRETLYAEIARANGHPEWLADIRATFADRWAAKAKTGWWVRRAGVWTQR
jgi:uncharacterized protein YdbL (DUF1318 family)